MSMKKREIPYKKRKGHTPERVKIYILNKLKPINFAQISTGFAAHIRLPKDGHRTVKAAGQAILIKAILIFHIGCNHPIRPLLKAVSVVMLICSGITDLNRKGVFLLRSHAGMR